MLLLISFALLLPMCVGIFPIIDLDVQQFYTITTVATSSLYLPWLCSCICTNGEIKMCCLLYPHSVTYSINSLCTVCQSQWAPLLQDIKLTFSWSYLLSNAFTESNNYIHMYICMYNATLITCIMRQLHSNITYVMS